MIVEGLALCSITNQILIISPWLVHVLKKYTVKPLITNTLEEFIKCRLDNFSMSFILYFVNFNIFENKLIAVNMREQF